MIYCGFVSVFENANRKNGLVTNHQPYLASNSFRSVDIAMFIVFVQIRGEL